MELAIIIFSLIGSIVITFKVVKAFKTLDLLDPKNKIKNKPNPMFRIIKVEDGEATHYEAQVNLFFSNPPTTEEGYALERWEKIDVVSSFKEAEEIIKNRKDLLKYEQKRTIQKEYFEDDVEMEYL